VTSRLSTARAEPRDAAARPVVTVWVLGFTCLVASLGQSLVVPLLPVLPERLGVSAGAVTWLVTITVLAAAVANPLLGRLGDQFGLRRVLLVTVGAYVAGSVICLVPGGFVVLLVGRGLQGAASAAIPLSISLMGAVLPRRERANGIASASAMMGVGGAVGLPLTGILNAWGGLTAVFLVTAVGGLLALVAIRLLVPVPAAATRAHRSTWSAACSWSGCWSCSCSRSAAARRGDGPHPPRSGRPSRASSWRWRSPGSSCAAGTPWWTCGSPRPAPRC